tara:strand:- start:56 stop:484 length:429 start_codon:yes stop_codon:yes gene_type:complete
MASILKVDTLTGVTTAGSISVTGEGNSTTTNLQQGLVKAWFSMNEGSTPAFHDSFNFGSITDNGTGDITVAFTSAFGNANYSLSGSNANTGTNYTRGPGGFYDSAVATSSYRYLSCFGSDASANGALRDDARMKQMYVGDLA